ncbi:thioester-forming surface-anchored protein [Corynebacterium diphtheriae]|uniref:thioester-forming surface-anchored protein n=1 Tax=Corynebacterium diphtheriae TaxID=1717 RepID=UPI003140135A
MTVANAAPSAATHRGFAEGTGDKASLLRVEPIAGGKSEIAYCMNEHKQRPIAKEGNEELPQYAVTDATGKFAQYTENNDPSIEDKLLKVLWNGMPNDAAGFLNFHGVDEQQFRNATQHAVWYFTDSSRNYDASYQGNRDIDKFYRLVTGQPKEGDNMSVFQKPISLQEVPKDVTLKVYEPTNNIQSDGQYVGKGWQNLLSATFVKKGTNEVVKPTPKDPDQDNSSLEISIEKRDIDTEEKIAGADLMVVPQGDFKINGKSEQKYTWTSKADAAEKIGFSEGEYLVLETKAPQNYQLPSGHKMLGGVVLGQLNVDKEDGVKVSLTESPDYLKVKDGTVVVYNKSIKPKDEPARIETFAWVHKGGSSEVPEDLTTDDSAARAYSVDADKAAVTVSDRVKYSGFKSGKYVTFAEVKSEAGATDKTQTVAYGLKQFEVKKGESGAGHVDVPIKSFDVTADGRYTVFERVYSLSDRQAETLKSLHLLDDGYKLLPSDEVELYIKNSLSITDEPVAKHEQPGHKTQTVSVTVKPKDVAPEVKDPSVGTVADIDGKKSVVLDEARPVTVTDTIKWKDLPAGDYVAKASYVVGHSDAEVKEVVGRVGFSVASGVSEGSVKVQLTIPASALVADGKPVDFTVFERVFKADFVGDPVGDPVVEHVDKDSVDQTVSVTVKPKDVAPEVKDPSVGTVADIDGKKSVVLDEARPVTVTDTIKWKDLPAGDYVAKASYVVGHSDAEVKEVVGRVGFSVASGVSEGSVKVQLTIPASALVADGKPVDFTVFERVFKADFVGDPVGDPVVEHVDKDSVDQTVSVTVKPKDVTPPDVPENPDVPGTPDVEKSFKAWWILPLIGLGALGVIGAKIIAQGSSAVSSAPTSSPVGPNSQIPMPRTAAPVPSSVPAPVTEKQPNAKPQNNGRMLATTGASVFGLLIIAFILALAGTVLIRRKKS